MTSPNSLHLTENIPHGEGIATGMRSRIELKDGVRLERAELHLQHLRPSRWVSFDEAQTALLKASPALLEKVTAQGAVFDGETCRIPDPKSYELVDEERVLNQITNAGRDQLHLQGYSSVAAGGSAPSSSGFNFIGLTNTAITPSAGDTSLSGEITANGLSRAQGAYAHTAGTNTTTISTTFTCATAPQSAQAAALFNAAGPPVAGTMNHELTFTQRSLQIGDQLACTYTITLG